MLVTLAGELDLAVAGEFEAALSEESLHAAPSVVVDLTGLEFMDSSGLRVLLLASERFQSTALRWAVVVPEQSVVRRLLSIAEVADRLPLHESREQAIASVSEPDAAETR